MIRKIIGTKTSSVVNYFMGVLLIASPWLFGFAMGTEAQELPVAFGLIMLMMSLCTNHESDISLVSAKFHLILHTAIGLTLAGSPWVFGFSETVYWPHLVLGTVELGLGMLSGSVQVDKKAMATRTA